MRELIPQPKIFSAESIISYYLIKKSVKRNMKKKLVICIENTGYEASLERWKVYRILTDKAAEKEKMIRVIDESGEGYLYPHSFFEEIELPKKVTHAIVSA